MSDNHEHETTNADPVQAAARFVDAMVYAFEPGSIMARSQETLTAVFAGALAADARVCDAVPELGPLRHPVRLAHVLCGGAGETVARELFGALRSEAVRREDPAMTAAAEKLKVIFEPFTSSSFRNATEAARNKLDALVRMCDNHEPGTRGASMPVREATSPAIAEPLIEQVWAEYVRHLIHRAEQAYASSRPEIHDRIDRSLERWAAWSPPPRRGGHRRRSAARRIR